MSVSHSARHMASQDSSCAFGLPSFRSARAQNLRHARIETITYNAVLSNRKALACVSSTFLAPNGIPNFPFGSASTPKLHGNVGLDDGHTVHLFLSRLRCLHLLVLTEVLNVFRMRQVFHFRVCTVILLKVVDLILIFIVAVMTGAETCSRKCILHAISEDDTDRSLVA